MISAANLAEWVRQELDTSQPDIHLVLRAMAKESGEWVKAEPERIPALLAEPDSPLPVKWRALIEGLVAYRCNQMDRQRPVWTKATKSPAPWVPYLDAGVPMSVSLTVFDALETPAAILDKGIVIPAKALKPV